MFGYHEVKKTEAILFPPHPPPEYKYYYLTNNDVPSLSENVVPLTSIYEV
jgi:hypothetical protein